MGEDQGSEEIVWDLMGRRSNPLRRVDWLCCHSRGHHGAIAEKELKASQKRE